MDLARVHRIAFQPVDLSTLDLGIPIGALDPTHHQAMAAALSQIVDIIADDRRKLLIGLNYKANAVPSGQLRVTAHSPKNFQSTIPPFPLSPTHIHPQKKPI